MVRIMVAVGFGVTLGATANTNAQDRPSPTTGGLPVEDPAIDRRTLPEEAEDVESETDLESDHDQRLQGAGPVEDPTLHITAQPDEEPSREEEPSEAPTGDEAKKAPVDDEADEEADGPNVQVDYDNGFLLSVNNWFFLALSGLVQARYTLNKRTDPPIDPDTMERDKHITQGFGVPRARFTLGIGLTEFVALVMRMGVVAGGSFEVQLAFIDLKWKHFRLRGGLFMNELIAESLPLPSDLFFADYSIVENVYSPGSSKGVMMTYLRERFSLNVGYSDGLRTGFSEIRSPVSADYAITLRTQYAWGELGLTGFNNLNARRGTPFGVRLAGAFHYQDGGRTGGSLPVKIAVGTVDLALRGSGWSVFLSGVAGQDSIDPTEIGEVGELITGGVTLMGGYFVLEDLQIFGQYSIVTRPKIQGTLPNGEMLDGTPSNFQAFGLGLSYFVIPGFDNVKVTTDFLYFLGQQAGSLVPTSPLNSIQPNRAGDQFAWRIQISGAF